MARSCRPPSRWARGSRPTRCACRPARAIGSNRLCWTSEHERPLAGAARARPRPPTATISAQRARRGGRSRPRRRVRGRPRDRAVERPVDLEHAGPVAEPLEAAGGSPAGKAVAGDRDDLAGVTSKSDGAGRRQLVEASRSRRPVTISPPRARSSATSASAIAPEPPCGRSASRRRGRAARAPGANGAVNGAVERRASSARRARRRAPGRGRRGSGGGRGP